MDLPGSELTFTTPQHTFLFLRDLRGGEAAIVAARLMSQLMTAEHYIDGFREFGTVGTQSPQVKQLVIGADLGERVPVLPAQDMIRLVLAVDYGDESHRWITSLKNGDPVQLGIAFAASRQDAISGDGSKYEAWELVVVSQARQHPSNNVTGFVLSCVVRSEPDTPKQPIIPPPNACGGCGYGPFLMPDYRDRAQVIVLNSVAARSFPSSMVGCGEFTMAIAALGRRVVYTASMITMRALAARQHNAPGHIDGTFRYQVVADFEGVNFNQRLQSTLAWDATMRHAQNRAGGGMGRVGVCVNGELVHYINAALLNVNAPSFVDATPGWLDVTFDGGLQMPTIDPGARVKLIFEDIQPAVSTN